MVKLDNIQTFSLNTSVLNTLFSDGIIGIYYLGFVRNGKFLIRYVGRSDCDLRRRLRQHTKIGRYTHFVYIRTKTIKEAYYLECREWHRLHNLDNDIHPDEPNYLNYSCPYCFKGAKIRLQLLECLREV